MDSDRRDEGIEIPSSDSASVERIMERVRDGGQALRAASDARVRSAIAGAADRLMSGRVGMQTRPRVAERAGLSRENVEQTIELTLRTLSSESLERAATAFARAHHGRSVVPVSLAAYVLAGNVYTAAIRPLAWALMLRVPVVVKPSSHDEGLAEAFAIALSEVDPELGESIGLARFGRDDSSDLVALSRHSDVLHAWGSDATIQQLRSAVSPTTAFVSHGHGLGAIWVPARAMRGDMDALARRIARDVALYDQRGCLSPHFVLVERADKLSRELAKRISEIGLSELATRVPRGPLPLRCAAQQLQWRGVGAARGELFEGDGWAVSFEPINPLRLSPGWRNLSVCEVEDRNAAMTLLRPFGVHLKALGVAGPLETRVEVVDALPPPLAPRVCEIGEMQAPGLLASADGEPPWAGLVRLRDLD